MTDPLDRMRTESDWLKAELTLRAEVERLRKERDEARRMLCEEWAQQDGLPLDWQGRRGAEGMAEFVKWDCYKENKENTND